MTENFLSIQEELRKVSDRPLSEAFKVFLVNNESLLCIDSNKETITLGECRNAPTGVYYFYQTDTLVKYWYNMNSNEPFLVVTAKPLQEGKHTLFLYLPPATKNPEP